jgi:hypothetical protein
VVEFIVGERISIVVFKWDCGFALADMREQGVCIKLNCGIVPNMKQAFGEKSLSQTQTYGRYKRLKIGRTSADDNDRSGRL